MQDEVLVLDFGYNDGDKELPRLRLKVASDAGIIGWITGITTNGEALVECTNLLAPEIVGLRRSHRESQRRSIIGPLVGPSKSYESGAGRFRRRWLPTGQYRVLQYTHVFSDADVASEIVSELEPGWTVEILSLQPGGSHQRPMACATLLPERVVRGWVLLQSKGFDIIDTRDLSEYEKVQAYLSHMEGDATADDEDDDAEEDEEEDTLFLCSRVLAALRSASKRDPCGRTRLMQALLRPQALPLPAAETDRPDPPDRPGAKHTGAPAARCTRARYASEAVTTAPKNVPYDSVRASIRRFAGASLMHEA